MQAQIPLLPPDNPITQHIMRAFPKNGDEPSQAFYLYLQSLDLVVRNLAAAVGSPTAWTPTIGFGGSSVGITFNVNTGSFITMGNLVYATFNINLSSKGAAVGHVQIFGLPFTADSNMGHSGSISVWSGMAGIAGSIGVQVDAGFNSLTLWNADPITTPLLTNVNFTNASILLGSITYIKA